MIISPLYCLQFSFRESVDINVISRKECAYSKYMGRSLHLLLGDKILLDLLNKYPPLLVTLTFTFAASRLRVNELACLQQDYFEISSLQLVLDELDIDFPLKLLP